MSNEANSTPADQTVEEVQEEVTLDPSESSRPEDQNKADGPENQSEESDEDGENKKQPDEFERYKHATQRRINRLNESLAESKRLLAELQNKPQNTAKTDPEPRQEDFESYEDFIKAQGRWEERQVQNERLEKERMAEAAEKQSRAIEEKRKIYEAQEAEFRKEAPDFDSVSNVVSETISTLSAEQIKSYEFQVFRDLLFSSENMPKLLYHLGKTPDALDQMLTMTPMQVARTLIGMEIEIKNAPKPQPQATPKPPAPVKTGSAKAQVDPDKLSTEEWLAWRNQNLKKKG